MGDDDIDGDCDDDGEDNDDNNNDDGDEEHNNDDIVMANLYTPPLAPTRQTLGSRREVARDPANTFIMMKLQCIICD